MSDNNPTVSSDKSSLDIARIHLRFSLEGLYFVDDGIRPRNWFDPKEWENVNLPKPQLYRPPEKNDAPMIGPLVSKLYLMNC